MSTTFLSALIVVVFEGYCGGTIDRSSKVRKGRNCWARVYDTYEPMGLVCEARAGTINVGLSIKRRQPHFCQFEQFRISVVWT
jgi:hypothetical protein